MAFKRGKKAKKEDLKELEEIYKEEGKLNLKSLEKASPKPLWRYLIQILLLILAVAAVGGFLVFNNFFKKSTSGAVLEIEVPEEVVSGEEVKIRIKYANQERTDWKNVSLSLQYPKGFILNKTSSSPVNDQKNIWNLGEIAKGRGGFVDIWGEFVGAVNQEFVLKAILYYEPTNFTSEFQAETVKIIRIKSSLLNLQWDIPNQIVNNKEFEINLLVENQGKRDLNQVKVVLNYPSDFEFIESDPQPEEGNFIWKFPSLKSSEKQTIKIRGLIKSQKEALKEFQAQGGVIDKEGNFKLQTQSNFLTLVVVPKLTLNFLLNGESGPLTVDWGNSLNYVINLKNTSDLEMHDVVIHFEIEGKGVNWDNLKLTKGKANPPKIIWDKNYMSELRTLDPQEEINLEFNLKVVSPITPQDEEDKNYQFDSRVWVEVGRIGDSSTGFKIEPQTITTKIKTLVSLSTEARYFSENLEPIGRGPLPPQVGKTTVYKIFWKISNTTNEIKDIEVTTTLPSYVQWRGQYEITAGQGLEFNLTTREIKWSINRIPPGTGDLSPFLIASFEIAVTPTKEQEGKLLILTHETLLKASDEFTGEKIEVKQDLLTSDLSNDVLARGKGIVVGEDEENINTD